MSRKDREAQIARLDEKCKKTTTWYVYQAQRDDLKKHKKADYIKFYSHRIEEISTLMKLRSKASSLRAERILRHELPLPPPE